MFNRDVLLSYWNEMKYLFKMISVKSFEVSCKCSRVNLKTSSVVVDVHLNMIWVLMENLRWLIVLIILYLSNLKLFE